MQTSRRNRSPVGRHLTTPGNVKKRLKRGVWLDECRNSESYQTFVHGDSHQRNRPMAEIPEDFVDCVLARIAASEMETRTFHVDGAARATTQT